MVWESGESFKRNMWQSFMVWESGESFCSIFGHNPRGWQSRRIPAFWESWTWSNVDFESLYSFNEWNKRRVMLVMTVRVEKRHCELSLILYSTTIIVPNSSLVVELCWKHCDEHGVQLLNFLLHNWIQFVVNCNSENNRVCKECGHFRKENAVPERARREGASPGRVFKWKEKRP